MNAQKRYPVDNNKVSTQLAKHGVHSLTQFSEMCGYSLGWAGNMLRTGKGINQPMLKALEGLGIPYECIKPADPTPKEKPVAKAPGQKTVADISPDELYSIIFKAVRDALNSN